MKGVVPTVSVGCDVDRVIWARIVPNNDLGALRLEHGTLRAQFAV